MSTRRAWVALFVVAIGCKHAPEAGDAGADAAPIADAASEAAVDAGPWRPWEQTSSAPRRESIFPTAEVDVDAGPAKPGELGMIGLLAPSSEVRAQFSIVGVDPAAHIAVLWNRRTEIELAVFDGRDGKLLDFYRTDLLSDVRQRAHPEIVDAPELATALDEIAKRLSRAKLPVSARTVAMSSDGTIAFVADRRPPSLGNLRGDRPQPDLYLRAKGGAPKAVAKGTTPVFSPDGKRLAFRQDQAIGFAQVESGSVAVIPMGTELLDDALTWSPDGRFLYANGRYRIGGKITVNRGTISATGTTQECLMRVDPESREVKKLFCDPEGYRFHVAESGSLAAAFAITERARLFALIPLPDGKGVRRGKAGSNFAEERVAIDPSGRVAFAFPDYDKNKKIVQTGLVLDAKPQTIAGFDDARWISADTLLALDNAALPKVHELQVPPPAAK